MKAMLLMQGDKFGILNEQTVCLKIYKIRAGVRKKVRAYAKKKNIQWSDRTKENFPWVMQ